MVQFKATGLKSVAYRKRKKPRSFIFYTETETIVILAVEEAEIENTEGTFWDHVIARRMDVLWDSVYKIVHKVLQFYLYKIKHVEELQPASNLLHPASREFFALELNSLHGQKWMSIGRLTIWGQMRLIFNLTAISTPIAAGFFSNTSIMLCTQFHCILLN